MCRPRRPRYHSPVNSSLIASNNLDCVGWIEARTPTATIVVLSMVGLGKNKNQ